jgi:hypothetical protein
MLLTPAKRWMTLASSHIRRTQKKAMVYAGVATDKAG